jgi:hypothetical protein
MTNVEKIPSFKMPDGPWIGEPSKYDGEYRGYKFKLRRTDHTYSWCGYVELPAKHPMFGRDYSDHHNFPLGWENTPVNMERVDTIGLFLSSGSGCSYGYMPVSLGLSVHGGVTWARHYPGGKDADTKTKSWWFGFDAGHCHDLCPGMIADMSRAGVDSSFLWEGTYRDMDYMIGECHHMIDQLVSIEHYRNPFETQLAFYQCVDRVDKIVEDACRKLDQLKKPEVIDRD